ncbi:MAG TPA: SDR family NAD(P)-dependent oxidoreductase, partial [Candidatus Glassbacteria bacterium]|nr:SDR family NAD(P)-dependent oxidoreductase [Candidatus Glassbacteria bacterium]
LAGMIKTAGKEWPGLCCRQIDIPASGSDRDLAAAIAGELLKTGPVEVGITSQCSAALRLRPLPVRPAFPADNPFPPGSTAVITGGARGITAETAVGLAANYRLNLLLLGRSPLPGPEPGWASGLKDEAAIKRAIVEQHGGARPTPGQVDRSYRDLLAAREIRGNLERIAATGVKVRYEAVDVRDAGALEGVLQRARSELGPVRALIHGAGVLADRLIVDKTLEQFREVWSTKVGGMRALLAGTATDELALMIIFSSSTARFGRKGQVDYAAANEALNKLAQQQQQERPACRVLSINWGPWDGGMVTPGLKQLFAGEGMQLIPLSAGTRYLLQEITASGPVEQVILGSPPPPEDRGPPAKRGRTPTQTGRGLQLAFERRLDIENTPVLRSHVMNGQAVLPAALIIEWLAHGAMHSCPGLKFLGFDDLSIYKGVVLADGAGADLRILAGEPQSSSGQYRIAVELRSGDILHAGAVIVLGSAYESEIPVQEPPIEGSYPFREREYYGNGCLFHGRDLQAILEVSACGV